VSISMEEKASRGAAQELRVADIFRRAGWKVRQQPVGSRADFVAQRGQHSYVVEVKYAAEARRDRSVPLLALAILQAQACARQSEEHFAPLAVLVSDRVSDSLVREVEKFVQDHAPEVAVGIVDLDGFQRFWGNGLDGLNASRGQAEKKARSRAAEQSASNLFSDLNQWMLKVLLAPRIPPGLLNAPRGEYRNASQLAEAADVSLMSAFRFLRQLNVEGFLNESGDVLELVRVGELFRRWQASHLIPAREVPMQWVLRGEPERQLLDAVRNLSLGQSAAKARPRVCLGVFAAADALGVGLVRGVAPHLYMERFDAEALQALGLSLEPPGPSPDVIVRLPAARESLFRGVVHRDGVPIADVLQVWLDAGAHPSRGAEQADLIYERMLEPILEMSSA
jgi:hypothetical protein